MKRIVVTVAADGTVTAETLGILGPACLDYVTVLEDLLEARAVQSAFTADHTASGTTTATHRARQEDHDVL
ncbi:hypothetical protein GCM10010399_37000 [Dactylosporangium fulvum]|uniref:DUF2997 domain-containing protein n=1 Tax=Dactylosporangium fulvum TaxID=53359 RepID=A0ABY5VVT4_9ACTN|nr:DUF2997 domain-containing protein [Dactylosporangium fulvum]UWP80926.1 DUF2997 domain-containing protein [Dactylosporangium fulvum]